MTFIQTMQERGFIKNTSFEVDNFDRPLTAYIGFDLTAPSLHVGSLIQLMVLRHLREHGHRPIVLLGEATTQIGDPSGKDTARQMLSRETIEANRIGITAAIDRVVGPVEIVSNAEWFNQTAPSFMDFMVEFGPHFTINRMMTFDSVKTRLDREQPLTLLEFSYMLLQAVDFLELKRRKGCNMQIGGSDQWGNIINGLEIIRRKDGGDVFAMTTPLLLDSSGNKMGKSQGKPVWLDPEMTIPFDFYQFWRNIDDADVERFLKLFTTVPVSEIETDHSPINDKKKKLAFEVTKLVYDQVVAEEAREMSEAIFGNGMVIAPHSIIVGASSLVEVMVEAKLTSSKSAARRLIAQNAVSIDGHKVSEDIAVRDGAVVKVGKQSPVSIIR